MASPSLFFFFFLLLPSSSFSSRPPPPRRSDGSAFAHSGIHPQPARQSPRRSSQEDHKKLPLRIILPAVGVSMLIGLVLAAAAAACRNKKRKESERGGLGPVEPGWVAEARARGGGTRVVLYEKPLAELTFADLAAATSGFSRDAQLSEGAVYRAVLQGDVHVAVKRLPARGVAELAALRHANLLPLLGHCLAAESSLLLIYPYMENGDLRRWLREPPLMIARHVDGWAQHEDWPTRHRIALGVARGLAYLHHAGRVHGELDARSVLLAEDLEPRVYYTGAVAAAGVAAEDVYGYGAVLFELLSGVVATVDVVRRVRVLVREGRGSTVLDDRIAGGEEGEMVEALRVAYLCTAEAAEKRPSSRQVVGMLKDIRSAAVV